jgi:hypothetical protein
VADGFPGNRRGMMTTWLKQKANDGVDIIGKFAILILCFL